MRKIILFFGRKAVLSAVLIWLFSFGAVEAVTVSVAADGSGNYNTDGSADQVEINNALNYIYSQGGGTVHLKNGNYLIDGSLIINDNTTLEGEGENTLIKLQDAVHWPINKALVENTNKDISIKNININIANLKIDGNRDNQTEPAGAFYDLGDGVSLSV